MESVLPLREPEQAIGTLLGISREENTSPCNESAITFRIPSLKEVVEDRANGEINREVFLNYLVDIHGAENFEFVLCVNEYLKEVNIATKSTKWHIIRKTFIDDGSQKEINLSSRMKKQLLESEGAIPNDETVHQALHSIYDILFDLYNEFVKGMKIQMESSRRSSDSVLAKTSRNYELKKPYTLQEEDTSSPISYSAIYPETSAEPISVRRKKVRGTSFSNMMDSLVNSDIISLKNTVKRFNKRRTLNEDVII